MKIIEPFFVIENLTSDILSHLERAGRTCYKSEHKIGPHTADDFLKKIIASGHESVLEHASVTVRFICDRGVSHELVRHRLCAFSQESTRYCNYAVDKFGNELTFIRPFFWKPGSVKYQSWLDACAAAENSYLHLLNCGAFPQEARAILPNSLKTEIVVTANIREWRHILRLRTAPKAHPQMRQLMIPLLRVLKSQSPILFADISLPEDESAFYLHP